MCRCGSSQRVQSEKCSVQSEKWRTLPRVGPCCETTVVEYSSPQFSQRGLRPQPKLEQKGTKVTKVQQSREFGNTV